jgi:hypothetical protein
MWADDSEARKSWLGPWSHLIHCDRCHALITTLKCPLCQRDFAEGHEGPYIDVDGVQVPALVFQGALTWTTHSLLSLMKREWERPLTNDPAWRASGKEPSQRMVIVILFWTLFEHLMDRLLEAGLATVPEAIRDDLMRRHGTIGRRMDRLYKLTFSAGMKDDLAAVGHANVFDHLLQVQSRRNEFVHGNSEAIDDDLVSQVVERLPDVQAAWVALFNYRCTGNPNAAPVWRDGQHRKFAEKS